MKIMAPSKIRQSVESTGRYIGMDNTNDILKKFKTIKGARMDGRLSPTGHESLMDVPLRNLVKNIFSRGITFKSRNKKVKGIKRLWHSPSFNRLKEILMEQPMKEGIRRPSSYEVETLDQYEGSDYQDSDDDVEMDLEIQDIKDRRFVENKAKYFVAEMREEYSEILRKDLEELKKSCSAWVDHIVEIAAQNFRNDELGNTMGFFKTIVSDMQKELKTFKLKTRKELFFHYYRSRKAALQQILRHFSDDVNTRAEILAKYLEPQLSFRIKFLNDTLEWELEEKLRQLLRAWDRQLIKTVEKQKLENKKAINAYKLQLQSSLERRKSRSVYRITKKLSNFRATISYVRNPITESLDSLDEEIKKAEESIISSPSCTDLCCRLYNFFRFFDSWHMPIDPREPEFHPAPVDKTSETPSVYEGIVKTASWSEVVKELLRMYQKLVDYVADGEGRKADYMFNYDSLLQKRNRYLKMKEKIFRRRVYQELVRMQLSETEPKDRESFLEKLSGANITAKDIVGSILEFLIQRATGMNEDKKSYDAQNDEELGEDYQWEKSMKKGVNFADDKEMFSNIDYSADDLYEYSFIDME